VRDRAWIKLALVFAGVAAGVAFFVLGRLTAGGYDAGTRDGHAAGLREGQAQGRREGQTYQAAQSAPTTSRKAVAAAFANGYAAGANDVFVGYDGGWGLSAPYVVTLGKGSGPVTYRIDSRTGMHAGVNYYLCTGTATLCEEPRR
jgi:hypothetical protein